MAGGAHRRLRPGYPAHRRSRLLHGRFRMSAKRSDKPVVIDGSGGIGNRNDFPDPKHFREAVNVDITRDARKRRRQGLTQLYIGRPEYLSGKVSDDFLLFVEGPKLQMVTAIELK